MACQDQLDHGQDSPHCTRRKSGGRGVMSRVASSRHHRADTELSSIVSESWAPPGHSGYTVELDLHGAVVLAVEPLQDHQFIPLPVKLQCRRAHSVFC
jgi:hypothetical protein